MTVSAQGTVRVVLPIPILGLGPGPRAWGPAHGDPESGGQGLCLRPQDADLLLRPLIVWKCDRQIPIHTCIDYITAPPVASAGENKLRASGMAYTVVRPTGLTKAPAGQSTLIAGA